MSSTRIWSLLVLCALLIVPTRVDAQKAAPSLLTPDNSVVLLIDHQPQMAFAVTSHDAGDIINNTVGLAKTAEAFGVPLVLTTVAAETFSGPLFNEVQAVYPEMVPIDRTTMNAWEDQRFVDAVRTTGRKRLVIAGLWTEICVTLPTLSALAEGYEVYIVTDASGGVTPEAHDMAVQRMIQAGAIPMTWLQVLLEYQRDWARTETYAATTAIVKEHGRAYGLGVYYAKAMLHVSGEGATGADSQ
jgi:nicotinamidase-related amidase